MDTSRVTSRMRGGRGGVGAACAKLPLLQPPGVSARCRWGDRTAPSTALRDTGRETTAAALGVETPPLVVVSMHELRVFTGSAEDPS
jgi:hypothetical protein